MRLPSRFFLSLAVLALGSGFSLANDGYRIVKSSLDVAKLEERLKAAAEKNKMNIVNRASASDGAKARGIAIKADVVLGLYRNDFAVRMLASNVDAGIEAPIRLHLVEEADGSSTIRYSKPSTVFGKYPGEELRKVADELDVIFESIVKDTIAP